MQRLMWVTGIAGLLLVVSACGGGSDQGAPPTIVTTTTAGTVSSPTQTTTTSASATTTTTVTPSTIGDGAGSGGGRAFGATISTGWSARGVGEGIKPVIALDGDGSAAVAFLFEDIAHGGVSYAAAGDEWAVEIVAEGYFYGPIGLDFDGSVPLVAYHDHQDDVFVPDKGDLTVATRGEGGWDVVALADDGHDGWDSTIAVGSDGSVHAAGVEPAQFNSTVGVEHYELVAGTWQVTEIGSGPIEYEWNVALAIAPDGTPGVAYFDHSTQDLMFAERLEGAWVIETVAVDGDVGRFSSLAYDGDGRPHISFVTMRSSSSAVVHYGVKDGGIWSIEDVATLDAVEIGFLGARRITSLALGPDGAPHYRDGGHRVGSTCQPGR